MPPLPKAPRLDPNTESQADLLATGLAAKALATSLTSDVAASPADHLVDLPVVARAVILMAARYSLPLDAIARALDISEMAVANVLATPKARQAVYVEQAAALSRAATDAIATLHSIVSDPEIRANPKALNPLTRACSVIISAAGHVAPVKTERAPWREPAVDVFAAGSKDDAMATLAVAGKPLSECSEQEIAAALRRALAIAGTALIPEIEGESTPVSSSVETLHNR